MLPCLATLEGCRDGFLQPLGASIEPTSFYGSYGKQHDLSPALCTEDLNYAASSKCCS